MRKKLAPILFVEDDPCGVQRKSVVSEAKPSESAKRKGRSVMVAKGDWRGDVEPFYMITKPTPLQSRAFELLGVKLQ